MLVFACTRRIPRRTSVTKRTPLAPHSFEIQGISIGSTFQRIMCVVTGAHTAIISIWALTKLVHRAPHTIACTSTQEPNQWIRPGHSELASRRKGQGLGFSGISWVYRYGQERAQFSSSFTNKGFGQGMPAGIHWHITPIISATGWHAEIHGQPNAVSPSGTTVA